jgi:hypothetical protein
MKQQKNNKNQKIKVKEKGKIPRCIARILGILFICFITLFSLDVFDGTSPIWYQILGFLIHSIPSIILLAVLLLAWKYETIGGVLYIIAGFGLLLLYVISAIKEFHFYLIIWAIEIASPAFIIGIIFLVSAYKHRKR